MIRVRTRTPKNRCRQRGMALSVPLRGSRCLVPRAYIWTLGIMSTSIADSHRGLLHVLFCLFETLLITSVVVLFCTDPRRGSGIDDAAGLTFWFAFIGLFTVSFILRRVARRLAVLGWLSLFGGFWSLAMLPVV